MTPEIDQQAFASAHADGALVLDMREPQEYVEGHVPGGRPVVRGPHATGTPA